MAKSCNIPLNPLFYEKLEAYENEALSIMGKGKGGCTEKERENCKFQFGKYFEAACKTCEKSKRVEDG